MTLIMTSKQSRAATPISRDTMQDRVYRRLCDMILDGEIEPGQLVTIQSLAEAFSVSHMPVREALKRLLAAKALTVVSGRSIGIPRLNRSALDDLRNVRLEIESLAAIWACRNIDADELKALRDECDKLESANAAEDVHSYLRANRAFHFSLYRAARSETLLSVIETLWLQISPYFSLLHESGNYSSANMQHSMIVSALEQKNEVRVESAIRADIDAAYHLLKNMVD
jgi:DNA-binding GntR family transcriptional regulator